MESWLGLPEKTVWVVPSRSVKTIWGSPNVSPEARKTAGFSTRPFEKLPADVSEMIGATFPSRWWT